MFHRWVATLAGAMLVASSIVFAQTPQVRMSPVLLDTNKLGATEREVYRVWDAYLTSMRGKRGMSANVVSPFWLQSEQVRWKAYALAANYLSDDAQPQTVAIVRNRAPSSSPDSVYRIITRVYPWDGKPTTDLWRNAMTMTVYAVRDGRSWKLSNALPRNTAHWKRDTVGPITYVYAPAYAYNRARALKAVAFTDSLAAAFGVPKLKPITYFLASTSDEMYGIMGLESDVKYGAMGGLAQPVNRMLFSGDPSLGEAYLHELAHLTLAPLSTDNTMYFYNEGVATWLGGTVGLSYKESLKGLAQYLREHPTATLDDLIDAGGPQTQLYRGSALLVAMLFERGGTPAVKSLFNGGQSAADFRLEVERIMQRPWTAVLAEWKKRALNAGNETLQH